MEKKPNSNIKLLPGFRFYPSDEELIVHYLRNKATYRPLPATIIADIDLYKCNPWELPEKALFGEEEWYFFTPRDRKYPNGARPNRMTNSGYWKATGTDKPIITSCEARIVGLKKALVFYKGRPPRGTKTEWIMHEYRLPDTSLWTSKQKGSMRLDDWVLCRVRQKSSLPRNNLDDQDGSKTEQASGFKRVQNSIFANTNTNLEMMGEYLYKDCPMLPFLLSSLDLPSTDTVSTISFDSGKTSTSVRKHNSDSRKYSQCSVPPFNGFFSSQKRKSIEDNQFRSFLHPNKKLNNRDAQEEEVSMSVSNDTMEKNFYNMDPFESNNLNGNQWNSIIQYQELNDLAFTQGFSK